MKVVMLGADRSVKGGVSAMVNNMYGAGLAELVDLTYIGTMVDGSSVQKLFKAAEALVRFLAALPGTDIVHLNICLLYTSPGPVQKCDAHRPVYARLFQSVQRLRLVYAA